MSSAKNVKYSIRLHAQYGCTALQKRVFPTDKFTLNMKKIERVRTIYNEGDFIVLIV